MRTWVSRLALALAALGWISASCPLPAAAAGAKKPELPAGGNTIGGPGRVTIAPGGETLLLRQTAATPFDLCLTLVHVGPKGTALLGIVRDPSSTYNGSQVDNRGDAVTVCRAASNEVSITCTSPGPPCVALWRVDQPR
jgi:hypothetical protein